VEGTCAHSLPPKNNSKNKKVFCDITSFEWARKSLQDIRKIDHIKLLLPIILYDDGVSIGMNGKVNVTPAMMSLGWYSKELYKQDYGNMYIGFINRLTNILEEELTNHLMELKIGFCRSRCV